MLPVASLIKNTEQHFHNFYLNEFFFVWSGQLSGRSQKRSLLLQVMYNAPETDNYKLLRTFLTPSRLDKKVPEDGAPSEHTLNLPFDLQCLVPSDDMEIRVLRMGFVTIQPRGRYPAGTIHEINVPYTQ